MKLKGLLKIAIRDSRKDRSKLFLFMSSIILGVAALVAINSFNYNLVSDIDNQAKTLLGADLVINGNKPVSAEFQIILDSIQGETASEIELLSMSYLPEINQSQFVRIKALEGPFPFYGSLLTEPVSAKEEFRNERTALLDESMMLQYNLNRGDSIRIGKQYFMIGGALKNAFGGGDIGSGFAPNVYIGKKFLEETELIQPGSLVDYNYFIKASGNLDAEKWKSDRNDFFRDNGLRIQTVEGQKENLEEAFSSLNNFLNLIALVSLLLACVGVASSVLIYIKNKIKSIAVLRCLGMNGNQAFVIYFLQILLLSLISVGLGAILGSFIQVVLPKVLGSFLPYAVDVSISGRAIMEGLIVGLIITMLFAMVPLARIRNISPLRTLRTDVEEGSASVDKVVIGIYFLIILSVFGFLWALTGSLKDGSLFTAGLLVSFGILFLVSKGVVWAVQKYFPRNWNFLFRQGLSNLYRPNNQTQTLIVAIGLGTAILTTLFVVQGLVLNNVGAIAEGNQPNMILFGIETRQKDEIAKITEEFDMPLLQQTPIVTMTVDGWKGRTKEEWLADTTRTAQRWAINRESRVSFSETLPENDELLSGDYVGKVNPGDSIFISLADTYAESLDVDLGDEIVWNVQGALITTYVGSIREINFRRLETRFFVLFPTGVLERAPQFHVLVTKSPDKETTASYRNNIVQQFPNVSVIDLGSILVTLNEILSKLSYAIQFMAGFSILIGLIVLISSLFLSKFQRINESVLMRTIGASRRQIFIINIIEYGMLGALSSLTGIVIAMISSFALMKFVFEFEFYVKWLPVIFVFLFVTLLTIIIGLANSREVVNKSPLEVLRREAA